MTVRTTATGVVFGDVTTQTTAAISLGLYNTVTGDLYNSTRFNDTNYTNSTGRPLAVLISTSNAPNNGAVEFYMNDVYTSAINVYGHGDIKTFIIPNGSTYRFRNNGRGTITQWREY